MASEVDQDLALRAILTPCDFKPDPSRHQVPPMAERYKSTLRRLEDSHRHARATITSFTFPPSATSATNNQPATTTPLTTQESADFIHALQPHASTCSANSIKPIFAPNGPPLVPFTAADLETCPASSRDLIQKLIALEDADTRFVRDAVDLARRFKEPLAPSARAIQHRQRQQQQYAQQQQQSQQHAQMRASPSKNSAPDLGRSVLRGRAELPRRNTAPVAQMGGAAAAGAQMPRSTGSSASSTPARGVEGLGLHLVTQVPLAEVGTSPTTNTPVSASAAPLVDASRDPRRGRKV